ncbi:prolipoprotein diacylglyceryl transferase [Gryllotalpicola ginsengisoli]|uniref:prolipoprotein diacylglyceryl transferase n=1 Tax=Gryllotalpicola ginsengisoli TaxID=444608 RepID=UPI000487BD1D|nr:prolipoprotein diacylglyceryl transferase [Gryllotalpicola ginsengisoli]
MAAFVSSIPSPSPAWQQLTIGPLTIRYYALLILLGIVLAAWWTHRRLTARGGEPGIVLDVVLWTVPLGIIGARAYHVLTHPNDYFYSGANLWNVFAIWEGGNAIFGALIGGAVGLWLACVTPKHKLRFMSFADALVPGLLLAQSIGRLGNYVNNELFGLPTKLPWGLEISSDNKAFPAGLPEGTLFHPLFLYEIIWNVLGIVVLLAIERKWKPRWGVFFGMYLVWYGAGRSYLESIRIDPSEYSFLGIPANVWAAFGAVVLGLVIIVVQTRRHPGLETSVYRPGYEWTGDDAAVDSQDSDSDEQIDGDAAAAETDSGAAPATSSTGS